MCNSGSFKLWVGRGNRYRAAAVGEERTINVCAVVALQGNIAECALLQIVAIGGPIVELNIALDLVGAHENVVHGQVFVSVDGECAAGVGPRVESECHIAYTCGRSINKVESVVGINLHLCAVDICYVARSLGEVVCSYV